MSDIMGSRRAGARVDVLLGLLAVVAVLMAAWVFSA